MRCPAQLGDATPAFAADAFHCNSLMLGNRLLAAKTGAVNAQRLSLVIAESGPINDE